MTPRPASRTIAAIRRGSALPNRPIDPFVPALAALVAALAATLALVAGPPDTFWTVDDAGKALVLRNLERHPADPSLDYPGRALDPELRLFPQPLGGSEPYAALRDGRIVSQYAAPFVWLALPFARVLAALGLALLPAFGAGASVLAAGVLATRLHGRRGAGRVAASIAATASPLLFYGAVFWEHSCTIALVGAASCALAHPKAPRAGTAGLLLGAAILLREELALLAIAVVAAALVERLPLADVARLGAGSAAGLAARAGFHVVTGGGWLGVHAGLNRPEPFVHAGEAVERLLLSAGFSGVPEEIVAVAIVLLAGGRFAGGPGRTVLLAAGGAAVLVVAALGWHRFPGGGDAALALMRSNSAILVLPWALVAPFLPAGVTSRDETAGRAARLLGRSALVFLALFLVLVPARSVTGVHPGPRMLLPLLPLVAAVAAERLHARRVHALALVPLLLVAFAWNVRAVQLLGAKRALAGELAAALRARAQPTVVTDLFWLPTEMAALWDTKRFHLLRSDRDLRWIAERARAAGETSIVAAVAPGRIPAEPVVAVRSAVFPAFAADVHVLDLAAPGAEGDAAP